MTRTFILTREFEKRWKQLGFTDEDLRHNLSKEERNNIKKMIEKLENGLHIRKGAVKNEQCL